MPVDLVAAALAPKAVMALAMADAHGAEDATSVDVASHQVAATTSFIQLPMAKSRILKMIMGPEIRAYNWLHDKFGGLWHRMFDAHVAPDQARMVEYYAASCPHCQHLEPVWKQAASQWASDPDAAKVVWQQKQCLDDKWKPGADFKECQEQGVMGFPTVKFFPPSSKAGDEFLFDNTSDHLVAFAKSGIHPSPMQIPREEGETADAKLVDYYAAACPHCKKLDPVWLDTEKKWDSEYATRQDAPLLSFEKKECYDDHWKPGKDFVECKKLGLHKFPTIKLLAAAENGHGFAVQAEFSEKMHSPEAIVNFVKKEADMEDIERFADNSDKLAASVASKEHVAPPIPEEETRNEPALSMPVDDKATLKVAPTEVVTTSNTSKETTKDTLAAMPEAIKTAMVPLPLASLSCLPVRRSAKSVQKRPEHLVPRRAPSTPTQFL